MKSACFIPIKSNSERVPGKNFRELNGKRLYQYICEHVQEADVFDDIYVDTNSEEVKEYASKKGFVIIRITTPADDDLGIFFCYTPIGKPL